MAEDNKPDDKQQDDKPANSGDIVNSKMLAHVKKLETTIASLENKQTTLEQRNGEMEKLISGLRNISSTSKPNRSLLDELNEMVFGPSSPTPPKEG